MLTVTVLILNVEVLAAEPLAYPFQFAVVTSAALVTQEHSINGLHLNLLYGANENVNGMDLGLVNYRVQNHRSLQADLVNLVGGDLTGFNITQNPFATDLHVLA